MLKRLSEEIQSKILFFFNFFSLMSVMQININDNDITDHSKNSHSQPPKEEQPEDKKKKLFGK